MLTELVLRSKAHWGYDEEFMQACREELAVHPGDVVPGRFHVAEICGVVVGVGSLLHDAPEGEVGHLFVDPAAMGTGTGRALWSHLVAHAARLGMERVRIEADPNAEGFYRTMGAEHAGTVASGSVAGRRLPVLVYRLVPAG